MSAPERIWLDWPDANRGDAVYDEPPERDTQPGQTEYIRKDASDAAIAAARAEGVREGMLKAAEIADAHEKRWNDTAYDRRQNGRDDNFACACASASTHIGIEIRAAAEAQP
jgi:hypothetical protein